MSLKDPSLFVPLDVEAAMDITEHVLFGISCCLHLPALYCLLRATPPHQAQIKPFLIACQASVVVSDVYYSVCFVPRFVAEVYFIYCKGILCRIVTTSNVMGIYIYTIGALALSTLSCIIARHQGMMPITSRWKASKNKRRATIIVVLFAFITPTTTFTVYPFDMAESERLMNESKYDLGWVRGRGRYYKYNSSLIFMHVISWSAITCFICTLVIAISLFTHMFLVLDHETATSKQTKLLIRQSLKRLFLQLNIPILLIAIPLIVLFLQTELHCFPISESKTICLRTAPTISEAQAEEEECGLRSRGEVMEARRRRLQAQPAISSKSRVARTARTPSSALLAAKNHYTEGSANEHAERRTRVESVEDEPPPTYEPHDAEIIDEMETQH